MGTGLECLIVAAGAAAFAFPMDLSIGPPPQLPPLRRYEAPAFPEQLRLTSIVDGYATMMFTIDAEGFVDDSLAIEASHPAFEWTMRDTLAKWRFERAPGASVPRREVFQFDFRRTGTVSSSSQRDASKAFFPSLPAANERPIRTVEWDTLVQRPERMAGVAPIYPQALRERGVTGHAVVSFVIDTTGRVRVPAIVAFSERAFGDAVLQAVRGWQFSPLLHEGERVQISVTRAFAFGQRQPAEATR